MDCTRDATSMSPPVLTNDLRLNPWFVENIKNKGQCLIQIGYSGFTKVISGFPFLCITVSLARLAHAPVRLIIGLARFAERFIPRGVQISVPGYLPGILGVCEVRIMGDLSVQPYLSRLY